jgi:Aph-1 protein
MDYDNVALFWGSAFVGFAPLICFFFQIIYPKSQLIIIFVTAAFSYLLSCLGASCIWYILGPILGLDSAWTALVPGILSQFFARCAFCALYHKVEKVIEISIERTEQEAATSNDRTRTELSAAKLKLELNDVASGLAAGIGFGGMHALLMYGSLLASEAADMGVLYQPSCPYLPSLIVSSVNSFVFFFLDIFWMLLTFFGMRRRLIFPRGGGTIHDMGPNRTRSFGGYYGNTRSGGNSALLTILISHFAASGFTTFNLFQYGCAFSMSLVPVVLLVVGYLYWSGVSKIYNPLPNSNIRLSLPASFSYGSHIDGGEEDNDAVLRARSDM